MYYVRMVTVDFISGLLSGAEVLGSEKRLSQLAGVFKDDAAYASMDPDQLIYSVQYYCPVPDGLEGGLFWGNTVIEPGRVGDEYFMTRGHFHAKRDRAEYYTTVRGEGALLLMGEDGKTRTETMQPGSVHYIPGFTAHRVANTGSSQLAFLACWPSDAGHDYETIERHGFSAVLRQVNGRPSLMAREAE